jgi:hypothetical protein
MKPVLAFLFSVFGLGILLYVFYYTFYMPLSDPSEIIHGMTFPLIDLVK